MLQDGKKPGQSRPQTGSNCHFGCILTLQRSPFLPHIVLSAGGYDWALYQDHFLEAPLMRSPYAPVQYTCAAWSPTRPGDRSYANIIIYYIRPSEHCMPECSSCRRAAHVHFVGKQLRSTCLCKDHVQGA